MPTTSVKVGRTHSEQMLRADIVRWSWHIADVPKADALENRRRGERHLPRFPQPGATVCLFHCFIALTRGTRSRRNSALLVNVFAPPPRVAAPPPPPPRMAAPAPPPRPAGKQCP